MAWPNSPSHDLEYHAARLAIMLAAADLIAWAHPTGFSHTLELTCFEITTFRHRVLHVAARITRSAHRLGRSERTIIPKSCHPAVFVVQHRRTPPTGGPWLRRSPGAVSGSERSRWPDGGLADVRDRG